MLALAEIVPEFNDMVFLHVSDTENHFEVFVLVERAAIQLAQSGLRSPETDQPKREPRHIFGDEGIEMFWENAFILDAGR